MCGRLRPGIPVADMYEIKHKPATAFERQRAPAHTHSFSLSLFLAAKQWSWQSERGSEVNTEELWVVWEEVESACSACGVSIQPTRTMIPLKKKNKTNTRKKRQSRGNAQNLISTPKNIQPYISKGKVQPLSYSKCIYTHTHSYHTIHIDKRCRNQKCAFSQVLEN